MFYIMTRAPFESGPTATISYDDPNDEDLFWSMGSRFEKAPIEPIRAFVKVGYGGHMPTLVLAPLCLMSRPLADLLAKSGVDNLDLYMAEILDRNTSIVHHDLVAFNLVGVASIADMGQSRYTAHAKNSIAVNFDELVVQPERARNALMFRLAESVMGIVAHESIKQSVERAGIPGVQFLEPKDWIS